MPQNFSDLGLSSDKILSVTRVSGDGSAGSLDTYNIKTRANPSGTGLNFTVQNGFNGAKGTDGIDGAGLQVVDFKDLSELTAWMDNDNNAKKIVAMVYRDTSVNPSIENSVLFSANLNSDQFHFFRVSWSQSGSTFSPSFLEIASLSNDKRVYAYYCETTEGIIAPRIAYLDTYTRNSGETDEQWLGRVLTDAQIFCDANSPLDNPIILASLEEYWQNADASVLIVPSVSAGNRYQQFTFLFNGQWKKATTSDGTSWNITGSDAAFLPLGVVASVESALSAAYNYYSSHADARLASPSCFALVGGKMVVIYPTEIGSGTATMNYSFGDISGYAETKDGGTTWVLRKNLVMGDYDASTGVGYAEEANNLVATKGLDVLNAFSYDSVGGNSSASVNDGNATINELIGVDVVKNQWLERVSLTTDGVATSYDGSTKKYSSVGSATNGYGFGSSPSIAITTGHIYLLRVNKETDANDNVGAFGFLNDIPLVSCSTVGEHFAIAEASSTRDAYVGFLLKNNPSTTSVDMTFRASVIDLTQRYGNNDVVNAIIGTDASTKVARLLSFDPSILDDADYETGALVPSKSAKLKSTGSNLIDISKIKTGYYASFQNGNEVDYGSNGVSVTDFIEVKEGKTYYFSGYTGNNSGNSVCLYDSNKNYVSGSGSQYVAYSSLSPITIPPGTKYIRLNLWNLHFSNGIDKAMLNVGSTALPYEPYEEPAIIDLPDIELHGMLTVKNGKIVPFGNTANPLGGGKGRFDVANLGTMNWSAISGNPEARVTSKPSNMKSGAKCITANGYLCVSDLTALYVGVGTTDASVTPTGLICFELAEETELESPSFQEFIPVKKGGTLEFLDSNDATAPLQGADIFYQKNIKGFVEGIGAREDIDWNSGALVSEAQFNAGINALTDGIKDGEVVAGLAKDLTPYSDTSGSEQSKPFTAQGTATDNGTAEVTVGSFAQLKEKQGNTLVWNQLVTNGDFSDGNTGWNAAGCSLSVNNNVATLTFSAGEYGRIFQDVQIVSGHKYLMVVSAKSDTATGLMVSGATGWHFLTLSSQWTALAEITTAASTETQSLIFGLGSAAQDDIVQLRGIAFIDLTQLFPDNTPTSVTDPRALWAIQYATLHPAYNAGSLIDGDGVKLACSGRNLWDEEWEVGAFDYSTGATVSNPNEIRSKNYLAALPNTQYFGYIGGAGYLYPLCFDANKNYIGVAAYDVRNQSFTTKPNTTFVKFCTYNYGSTYNHDITISLWYASGQDYDEYFPYEEPKVYDTGNEVLRSAGSVRDSKKPDGTITRRVNIIDLSELSWSQYDTGKYSASRPEDMKLPTADSVSVNALSTKYSVVPATTSFNAVDYAIALSTTGTMFVKDVSGSPSGYLVYETTEPTTEQGTPFPENIAVNDYGMMTWLKADGTYAEVPQGALFFYPADYKGMLDDVYYRTTPAGNASDLVVQSELSASETARDAVDAQLKEALGGTLRQLLAVRASIDFANTAWVDLGKVNFDYNVSEGVFYSVSIAGLKNNEYTSNALVSTLYKTNGVSVGSMNNMEIRYYGYENKIIIKNTAYTDATAFKAAMKGVLLAYEKA